MNTLTTNIIRNVYNIGTNSCDAGTQYCTDGYALYFPCLKDITKGQDVCFDFYVADSSTKDVVDLRTVDAITLNLNGQYNCSYGTFSYPDNISSLQTEDYSLMYSLDFDDRKLCCLSVAMVDKDTLDVLNIIGDECDSESICFWSGTKVELEAKNTKTHIFIGWAKIDNEDTEECADDTLEDYIISKSSKYSFIIKESTRIIAVYRRRKTFNVISDTDNKSSHFIVYYNNRKYYISNRPDDGFDEREDAEPGGSAFDVLEDVIEGYKMFVKCEPCDNYNFIQWCDGYKKQSRTFFIGESGCNGTKYFEDGNTIKLRAICSLSGGNEESESSTILPPYYDDQFDEEGIHLNTEPVDIDIYDYYGDGDFVLSTKEVYQKFIGEDGYLYFNSGNITLSSIGIEDGVKINIHAKADESCELHINVNDYEITQEISTDEFKLYEFYFSKCDKSDINITVYGECLVDKIELYEEVIIDKGKAQLCLDSEVTANLPSGPLSVNGAVMVDGKSYGLSSVSIGQVNRLPKIDININ